MYKNKNYEEATLKGEFSSPSWTGQGLVGFAALTEAHSIGWDPRTRKIADHSVQGLYLERQPAIWLPSVESAMEHVELCDQRGIAEFYYARHRASTSTPWTGFSVVWVTSEVLRLSICLLNNDRIIKVISFPGLTVTYYFFRGKWFGECARVIVMVTWLLVTLPWTKIPLYISQLCSPSDSLQHIQQYALPRSSLVSLFHLTIIQLTMCVCGCVAVCVCVASDS